MALEEVVLLIVSLIGFGAGLFGVYDAWHDIRFLDLKNGRKIVARANMRAQLLRTVRLALFVTVAVVSIAAGPSLSNAERTFVVWSLVGIAVISTADAVLDRLSRRRILHRKLLDEDNVLRVRLIEDDPPNDDEDD